MSATIDPASSSPTVNFDVINTTDAPVAVQMRATTRRIDRDGTEFNEDAADRLQVFPTQLILRPGQRQAVRVRWIGGGVPREELPSGSWRSSCRSTSAVRTMPPQGCA
jgi:fimbrial chaperone protein